MSGRQWQELTYQKWWITAHRYVFSVNALIGGNLFFLELYFEVPSYQKA